jgi:hypothetical protein
MAIIQTPADRSLGKKVAGTLQTLLDGKLLVEARIDIKNQVNVLDLGAGDMWYAFTYAEFFSRLAKGKSVKIMAADAEELYVRERSLAGIKEQLPNVEFSAMARFPLINLSHAETFRWMQEIDGFDFITIFNPCPPREERRLASNRSELRQIVDSYVFEAVRFAVRDLLYPEGLLMVALSDDLPASYDIENSMRKTLNDAKYRILIDRENAPENKIGSHYDHIFVARKE